MKRWMSTSTQTNHTDHRLHRKHLLLMWHTVKIIEVVRGYVNRQNGKRTFANDAVHVVLSTFQLVAKLYLRNI